MADPVSIAMTCTGLLATVAKTCTQIYTFVSKVRDARRDMDAVTRELSSLALCLESLRGEAPSFAKHCPKPLQQNLVDVMGDCEKIVKKMQKYLEKYTASEGVASQVQWTTSGCKEIDKLRSNLETHKRTLEMVMDTMLLRVTASIKDDTKAIRKSNAEIINHTSQIPELVELINRMMRVDFQSISDTSGQAPPPYQVSDNLRTVVGSPVGDVAKHGRKETGKIRGKMERPKLPSVAYDKQDAKTTVGSKSVNKALAVKDNANMKNQVYKKRKNPSRDESPDWKDESTKEAFKRTAVKKADHTQSVKERKEGSGVEHDKPAGGEKTNKTGQKAPSTASRTGSPKWGDKNNAVTVFQGSDRSTKKKPAEKEPSNAKFRDKNAADKEPVVQTQADKDRAEGKSAKKKAAPKERDPGNTKQEKQAKDGSNKKDTSAKQQATVDKSKDEERAKKKGAPDIAPSKANRVKEGENAAKKKYSVPDKDLVSEGKPANKKERDKKEKDKKEKDKKEKEKKEEDKKEKDKRVSEGTSS